MAGPAITIPFEGVPLHEQAAFYADLEAMGYSGVWSSEAQDLDGFVPLAVASQQSRQMRLGCAVLPVQTRGPAALAMSVAAMADAAPGRFVMGVGASSEFIVRFQNDRPFEKPLQQVRDTVRFLKAALRGEAMNVQYPSFEVRGFKLHRPLEVVPPILVGALREGMLSVAGEEGDGVVLNYVTPPDLAKLIPIVRQHGADKEITGRIYVCPTRDAEAVRKIARRSVALYFSVPTYRRYQEWLGHGALYEDLWKATESGDFRAGRAALSDESVDRFYIHGPPEACKERIAELIEAGLETPIIGLVEGLMDPREAARLLAPAG